MYDELYHHGMPGQKWGVRHGPPYPVSRGSDGRARNLVSVNKRQMTSSTRSQYGGVKKAGNKERTIADEVNSVRKKKKIRVSKLTDEQLRERIARLELEKKYKELVRGTTDKKAQKQTSEGKKVLYQTLGKIGEMTAKTVVEGVAAATIGHLAAAPKKARNSAYGAMLERAASSGKTKGDDKPSKPDKPKTAEELRREREAAVAARAMEVRLNNESYRNQVYSSWSDDD